MFKHLIRVIFITSDDMAEDNKSFLPKAKPKYKTKPFNIKLLRREITAILAGSV